MAERGREKGGKGKEKRKGRRRGGELRRGDFKAKMHQIRFPPGLRHRSRMGSL